MGVAHHFSSCGSDPSDRGSKLQTQRQVLKIRASQSALYHSVSEALPLEDDSMPRPETDVLTRSLLPWTHQGEVPGGCLGTRPACLLH